MSVIENLIKIMENKQISAYRIEKEAGINGATITSWKKGAQPPADKIDKLCSYLSITPNDLFGYESITLTENEKEMLELFKKLPEREQIKFIGRLEDKVTHYIHEE